MLPLTPAAIAGLVQWFVAGQQAFAAGKAFWDDLSVLFDKHGIEVDKAQMLKWADEADQYAAKEREKASKG